MGPTIYDSLVTITRYGEDGRRYEFNERPWVNIGTHVDNDIVIDAENVALLHASVSSSDDQPRIYGIDKHLPVSIPSRGIELRSNAHAPIYHDDIFYCGSIAFRFERRAAETVTFRRDLLVAERNPAEETDFSSSVNATEMSAKDADAPIGADQVPFAISLYNDANSPSIFHLDAEETLLPWNNCTPEKESDWDFSRWESEDLRISPCHITPGIVCGATSQTGNESAPCQVPIKSPSRTPLRILSQSLMAEVELLSSSIDLMSLTPAKTATSSLKPKLSTSPFTSSFSAQPAVENLHKLDENVPPPRSSYILTGSRRNECRSVDFIDEALELKELADSFCLDFEKATCKTFFRQVWGRTLTKNNCHKRGGRKHIQGRHSLILSWNEDDSITKIERNFRGFQRIALAPHDVRSIMRGNLYYPSKPMSAIVRGMALWSRLQYSDWIDAVTRLNEEERKYTDLWTKSFHDTYTRKPSVDRKPKEPYSSVDCKPNEPYPSVDRKPKNPYAGTFLDY